MIPGLGKEIVTLGSAPDCDVILQGPGVAPHHARIVKQGGALAFLDLGAGPTAANGAPLAPNQPVPFDFRTQFTLGQTPVPLAHPAIALMLMSPGTMQAPRGHVVLGREAARASLVIGHPAVSGTHATVMLDRMQVVDHGSTSGTYVNGQRSPPNQPVPIDPNGVIAFGPIPVPVLVQIAQSGGGRRARRSGRAQPPPAGAPASAPAASAAAERRAAGSPSVAPEVSRRASTARSSVSSRSTRLAPARPSPSAGRRTTRSSSSTRRSRRSTRRS